jgi:sugar phosphate isomerase/epimerase
MALFTRRQFLLGIGSLPVAATVSRILMAQPNVPFKVGSQSYSFRHFKELDDCLAQLKALGVPYIEFCSVHFPPDPNNPALPQIKETLARAGVTCLAFGVEGFTRDAEANRRKFTFGKALGVEVLTADPTPDAFESLEKLVEEFQIKIAIHNHGPGARYDKVEDTLKAVQGKHPLIGACVDTGHVIRSGEKPHEVIRALGKRVHSLHLKDWKHGGAEQVLGEGDINLVEVARALKEIGFSGPLMLEYEDHPEDPVPHMKRGLANWNAAVKEVFG